MHRSGRDTVHPSSVRPPVFLRLSPSTKQASSRAQTDVTPVEDFAAYDQRRDLLLDSAPPFEQQPTSSRNNLQRRAPSDSEERSEDSPSRCWCTASGWLTTNPSTASPLNNPTNITQTAVVHPANRGVVDQRLRGVCAIVRSG
jgi:hypothetical protein